MKFQLILVALLISFSTVAQKLVKAKLDDNIIVKVPNNFIPMTDEDKAQRYESSRLPIALYSDEDRLVDFGVNRSFSIWQESDLDLMLEFYEASIIELYDKVEFDKMGIEEVNGRQFVVFEFESVVYPENDFQRNIAKYTYLMYTLNKGTTYLFNFTCEKSVKNLWQGTAREMMSSIKIK
jgi:hypothetical protein